MKFEVYSELDLIQMLHVINKLMPYVQDCIHDRNFCQGDNMTCKDCPDYSFCKECDELYVWAKEHERKELENA